MPIIGERAVAQDALFYSFNLEQHVPNGPHRKILRSIHEGARDLARDIPSTDAYVTSRRERKKVEKKGPDSRAIAGQPAPTPPPPPRRSPPPPP